MPAAEYSPTMLTKILQDREQFTELGRFFIRKTVQGELAEHAEQAYLKYLEAGLELLLQGAIDIVFSVCESPIEKVLVNSLFLAFIKADPLNLVITPPFRNAPLHIQEFRDYHARFGEFLSWYRHRHGGLSGIEEYLDGEVRKGKMEEEERRGMQRHLVLYEYLRLYDRFHLSLQSHFPDLRIDGRTLRPDMLIWIPGNDRVRIVVECDGFQYHADKAAFTSDRKKERLLQRHEYKVLRYSGSEIHQDPIRVGSELFEFLQSTKRTKSSHS